jgi:hypothetical protein
MQMQWCVKRLKEPSTYASTATIILAAGVIMAQPLMLIAAIAVAVAGIMIREGII